MEEEGTVVVGEFSGRDGRGREGMVEFEGRSESEEGGWSCVGESVCMYVWEAKEGRGR